MNNCDILFLQETHSTEKIEHIYIYGEMNGLVQLYIVTETRVVKEQLSAFERN